MKNTKYFLFFLFSFPLADCINILSHRQLNQYGLIPRNLEHLTGIFSSVWLHGNLSHLLANFSALIVLAFLCKQWGNNTFWKTTSLIIILSGVLVWIFGRPSLHIGASGLVYGYFGFSIIAGWISKKVYFTLISIAVAIFYGSMIWGVLPSQPNTSFEYHLAGFISGIFAAKLFAAPRV
ncbi:rhomboid family intramembrane serine protease [Alteromonas sp. 5E99-2]|uniref:rhomboid family intramembrane serine protease n=1 Tax=Alteromonas sp. 5E99-2 TaxID=2817683 RepID=UPI001A99CA91|nr:rhomboid family intramembrane serine protease [Alteromonas sp. 5E99-2]MBO1256522.1 rhomboid family intramembrane serine protease [Alteromonas sp. 5E99-2]